MTNVHTIQETKQREQRESIIVAEKTALDLIDLMSEYNLATNVTVVSSLDTNHRETLLNYHRLINKQPLLVQSEIAKKSIANEYLLSKLFDKKIIETTELANENKVLLQENNIIKSKLEESDLVYDASTINRIRIENQKEIELMKRNLDSNRQKKRELGQSLLLSNLSSRR